MASLLAPDQVGWFAARQPAVVRTLEATLGPATDAFAVALDGAWRLSSVFELRDGVPPRRLSDEQLDRSRRIATLEGISRQVLADGGASRQPELCRWVASYVSDPPVPLSANESADVGRLLIALLYALDEVTQGSAVATLPKI
jgi:hypothetical protein